MRRWIVLMCVIIAILLATLGVVLFLIHRTSTNTQDQSVAPVTTTDHILGNPGAPVLLVEYCDIESPYCRNFEAVLEGIIGAYGKSGTVAWVYRHLTLTDQYPDSEHFAEAAECVAAQTGTDGFFKFIDAMNALTEAPTDDDVASVVAGLGISAQAFSDCMSSGTYADRVKNDTANALASGAIGAPYTIVLINGKPSLPIQGVLSYSQMKQLLDTILSKVSP